MTTDDRPENEELEPPPMPGMVWEWRRNYVIATCVLLAIMFATLFLPKSLQLTLPYFFAVVIAVILVGYRIQIRKRFRNVNQAQFRVCPECGYCLDHLPDEYKCPECGTPYRLQDLAKRWENWHEPKPPAEDSQN